MAVRFPWMIEHENEWIFFQPKSFSSCVSCSHCTTVILVLARMHVLRPRTTFFLMSAQKKKIADYDM